jgi:hypothetical protein
VGIGSIQLHQHVAHVPQQGRFSPAAAPANLLQIGMPPLGWWEGFIGNTSARQVDLDNTVVIELHS